MLSHTLVRCQVITLKRRTTPTVKYCSGCLSFWFCDNRCTKEPKTKNNPIYGMYVYLSATMVSPTGTNFNTMEIVIRKNNIPNQISLFFLPKNHVTIPKIITPKGRSLKYPGSGSKTGLDGYG